MCIVTVTTDNTHYGALACLKTEGPKISRMFFSTLVKAGFQITFTMVKMFLATIPESEKGAASSAGARLN